MFYRLEVNGSKWNVLIRAKNTVMASGIVSDFLASFKIDFEDYQIFPVSEDEITRAELEMCVLLERGVE